MIKRSHKTPILYQASISVNIFTYE